MTIKTKTSVKSFFETGDKPTEAQFADLIDSYQDHNDALLAIATAAQGGKTGVVRILSSAEVTAMPVGAVGAQLISVTATASAQSILGIVSASNDVSTNTATATKGTALRTLAAHFSDAYNVLNYGAVGDGTTIDVTAINAAISAAAAAGGGAVFFPTGVYRVNAPVLPKSNTTLFGCGPRSIIRLTDAAETHTINIVSGQSNILIENLKVDGNRANQATQAGVGIRSVDGCSNIEVRNCHIVSAKNQGIAFFGTTAQSNTGMIVRDCLVRKVGSHGIYCADFNDDVLVEGNHVENWGIDIAQRPGITVGRPGTDCRVLGNIVKNAGGTTGGGISMDRVIRGLCSDNIVTNVTSWGIEVVDGATDIVVSDNQITSAATQGIAIQGNTNGPPQRINIVGNIIRLAASAGIRSTIGLASSGPVSIVIAGNTVHQSGDRGIEVLNTLQCMISNNIVRNSQNAGIWVGTASDNVVISGNISTNNNQSGAGEVAIMINNTAADSDFVLVGNGATNTSVISAIDVSGNNAVLW